MLTVQCGLRTTPQSTVWQLFILDAVSSSSCYYPSSSSSWLLWRSQWAHPRIGSDVTAVPLGTAGW
eukprot:1992812-Alexandrium_andersonii.AAC.1